MSEANGTGQTPQTEGQAAEAQKPQAYIAEFFAGARIGRGLVGSHCHLDELKRRLNSNRNGAVE